jgi:RNA polymerase subunit RPABC4/transcription elongation factor Spt4
LPDAAVVVKVLGRKEFVCSSCGSVEKWMGLQCMLMVEATSLSDRLTVKINTEEG